MFGDHIGEWLVREYDSSNYHDTKPHKVESKVNGGYLTKCGRWFAPHTNAKVSNRLTFSIEGGADPCHNCDG